MIDKIFEAREKMQEILNENDDSKSNKIDLDESVDVCEADAEELVGLKL